MNIRALSPRVSFRSSNRPKSRQNLSFSSQQKPKQLFQHPLSQQKPQPDDVSINWPLIMPHLEQHRPLVKKRILELQQGKWNIKKQLKCKTFGYINYNLNKNEIKSYYNQPTTSPKCNKPHFRHSIVHQLISIQKSMFDNENKNQSINKFNKLQCITITHLPLTYRKPSYSLGIKSKSYRVATFKQSHCVKLGNQTNRDFNHSKGLSKLQPWEHKQEDGFNTLY